MYDFCEMLYNATNAFPLFISNKTESNCIFDTWKKGFFDGTFGTLETNYSIGFKWRGRYNGFIIEKCSSRPKNYGDPYDQLSFLIFNYFFEGSNYYLLYLMKYFDSEGRCRLAEFKRFSYNIVRSPDKCRSDVSILLPENFNKVRGSRAKIFNWGAWINGGKPVTPIRKKRHIKHVKQKTLDSNATLKFHTILLPSEPTQPTEEYFGGVHFDPEEIDAIIDYVFRHS